MKKPKRKVAPPAIRAIVRAALNRSGGMVRWAKRFGYHRSTVCDWIKAGAVPANRAVVIERESHHVTTRQEMRPTDYWEWWPDLPKPSEDASTPAL